MKHLGVIMLPPRVEEALLLVGLALMQPVFHLRYSRIDNAFTPSKYYVLIVVLNKTNTDRSTQLPSSLMLPTPVTVHFC